MEDVAAIETIKVDPMRVIGLREVCERTGYGRMTVLRALKRDQDESAPGRCFPAPLQNARSNRLEWREIHILRWLQEREQ